jgi:nitrite reductase/ring-hydroxylating ferredoxin subunit
VSTSRRDLLLTGWKIGGALLAGAAGWTIYESLRPLASAAGGGPINLGNPSRYPPESATYVPQGPLFVANSRNVIHALSQKCPHLGCRVPFCDSSGWFECPCHGSKYDLGGEWIEGPAPRGMDRYDLKLVGGNLIADTSKVIDGPTRGTKRYYAPAKGPSCLPTA